MSNTSNSQTIIKWRFSLCVEGNDSCQLCGHGIKRLFYVVSNTGEMKIVGSECVESLLGGDYRSEIDLANKCANRAAKQWKDKTPAIREGETRTEYINRRVKEMSNARKAYNAFIAKAREIEAARVRLSKEFDAELRDLWSMRPATDKEYEALVYKIRRDAAESVLAEIEGAFSANRFDFVGRAVWDVRKI